jgi:hypothetical protein
VTLWQHIFEWLQGGYGKWVCEDAVIGRNPNWTHSITLGYRNTVTNKTRIFWYHIDFDEILCLKADDFLGITELLGIDMTDVGPPWP